VRLLLVIRSLGHGGAERQLSTLARALAGRGLDVTVATFYGGGALEGELAGSGVTLRSIGKRGRWDVAGFLGRLAGLVRSLRPDVIHGYMPTSNLVATALRPLVPGARLVWGVRASGFDWDRYDWLARREFELTRALARRPELIIANSHEGAQWHAGQGYPADRMLVVPNGIDVDRFKPDASARVRMRVEWEVADDAFLVGLVGRLDPMKDHPTFLRAAARVAARVPNARFVCVGEGPAGYAAELRRQGESLGLGDRLRWAPPRRAVQGCYAALDALASTSAFGEGFSNVIGEAMACGVPCVVTDCGDAARIVAETGTVVPVGDDGAVADALAALAAADRAPAGAAARARVAAEFSVERLADRTAAALRALRPGGAA
jgi:glycosyltransferase involved in cell wall biosynthesis